MLKVKIKNNLEYLFIFIWYVFLLSPFFSHIGVSLKLIFNVDVEYLNHLNGISAYIQYFLIVLVFVISALLFINREYYDLTNKFKKIIYITLPGSILYLIAQNFLITLNAKRYSNFLYSQTGFAIENIQFTGFFCTVFVFVAMSHFLYLYSQKFGIRRAKRGGRLKILKGFEFRLLFLVSLFLVYYSLYPFISFVKILSESGKSYDYVLGSQYKYIEALIKNVPDDSAVIHPPQSTKWPAIGNQVVLRYFLFPRMLVSGALLSDGDLVAKIGDAYFVEIDPDSETAWPQISKNMVIFNEENSIMVRKLILISDENNIKVFHVFF